MYAAVAIVEIGCDLCGLLLLANVNKCGHEKRKAKGPECARVLSYLCMGGSMFVSDESVICDRLLFNFCQSQSLDVCYK